MTLKYRITDVKDLQTHILQDYLRMELNQLYPEGSWKESFYNEVKTNRNGPFKSSYEGAWTKLLEKGTDEYSVEDMDITTISCVLLYMNSLKLCKDNRINNYIKTVTNDRNFESHLNSNESSIELFQFLSATLHTLKEMTIAIGKYSHAPEDDKEQFARINIDKINELSKAIQKEYEKDSRIEALVEKIVNEKNIRQQNVLFSGTVVELMKEQWSEDYEADYFYFCNRCADAGIRAANIRLAEEYAHYSQFYYRNHIDNNYYYDIDYHKAEQLLLKCGPEYEIEEQLLLASLYVNGLSRESREDDGWTILRSLIDRGIIVLKHTTEDGHTFYYRGSKVYRPEDEVLELK